MQRCTLDHQQVEYSHQKYHCNRFSITYIADVKVIIVCKKKLCRKENGGSRIPVVYVTGPSIF